MKVSSRWYVRRLAQKFMHPSSCKIRTSCCKVRSLEIQITVFTCWDVVEVVLFLPFLPAPSAFVRTILTPYNDRSQVVEALKWFSSIKCSRLLWPHLHYEAFFGCHGNSNTEKEDSRQQRYFVFPSVLNFARFCRGFSHSHFPWLFLSRWVPTWSD